MKKNEKSDVEGGAQEHRPDYSPQPGRMGSECAYCRAPVETGGVIYATGFVAHEDCHEIEVERLRGLQDEKLQASIANWKKSEDWRKAGEKDPWNG